MTTLHPVDQTVLNSIRAIVDYGLATEAADYEEQHPDDREGHVFLHLLRVAAWLEDAPADSATESINIVHVIDVDNRDDGAYVFADLDDARAFEATINASDLPTFVVPSCYRTEEVVLNRTDTLRLIAAECEATEEAVAASLETGTPVATHAWKRGEDAPYPDKLECVDFYCYPAGSEEGDDSTPSRFTRWVGLHPEMGCVNVDAGRERLETEGWEVTDWGAA